jgi:hypothetical protein
LSVGLATSNPAGVKRVNGILQCFWRLPQLLAALRSGAGVDQARRPSTGWQRPPLQRATAPSLPALSCAARLQPWRCDINLEGGQRFGGDPGQWFRAV